MPLYNFIQAADQGVAFVERWLAIALTAVLTGIMMAQVILRYFFSAPLFWAEEVAVQLLVFMTLIGLSLLVRGDALIKIDLLSRLLPPKGQRVLSLVLGLLFLGLLGFLAWLGWEWVQRPEARLEMSATTQLPRWYNYAVLPATVLAMAFHQFAWLLREAAALKGARA
ncbi:TRAP transporter small permease [Caldimonas tepidiphila]|uniref:TRAP transporter small permease n=1 Tax=Caldimonas tepidiphila TaxID=2315841 RepID=UPI000E5B8776|nr:TRAP transporter small permease [Caldimonas tepidiphila]